MRTLYHFHLLSIFFLLTQVLNAQDKTTFKSANKYFNEGDFKQALTAYLLLLEADGNDQKLNYRIGVCYLNTNIDKPQAIPYLEKVINTAAPSSNLYYLLGRAYHYAYRFNEAVEMFNSSKFLISNDLEFLIEVEKQIEYCYNAIEMMKFPLNVTFQNLGLSINTPQSDFHPFIPKDESFLIYNTKREDGDKKLLNGSYRSKIYRSNVVKGTFSKAKKIIEIDRNEEFDEVIGLSANGRYLLFRKEEDLYKAEYQGRKVKNIEKLPETINSKMNEFSGSISSNGEVIYFSSDRAGGYGGIDIYVAQKLPNGTWGAAQNLGGELNTEFDDDFPNISPDGKTFYFSSKGHTSIGGYDIFKASWNREKGRWSDVKNIGYPLNTPEDNINYRSSNSGRTGYISAVRKDGYGDLDIYSVTFNGVAPDYSILKGYVNNINSSDPIKEAVISVVDLDTNKKYGSYMTNPASGRFVLILPPGNYKMIVEVTGYEVYAENVEIFGKGSRKNLIEKNIYLIPSNLE